MLYCQKLNLVKKIILISLYVSIFPLTVIFLVLGDISVLVKFLKNYFISGKSLFVPFLPNYNVFWFLPKKAQITQFNTGKLLDLFIVISFISLSELAGYQYYKKICLNEDFFEYDQFTSNQEGYTISKDQGIFFGFNEESCFYFDNRQLHNNHEENLSFRERLSNNSKELRNRRNKIVFIGYRLLKQTILNEPNFKFFCFQSNYREFNNNLSNIRNIYPQIKTNDRFSNSYQYPGINTEKNAYFLNKINNLIIKINCIQKSICCTKKK